MCKRKKYNNIIIEKSTLPKMFSSGNGFKDTFQSLYKTISQLNDDAYFFKQNYYFDVATVNASFACEIYLKLLYNYENIGRENCLNDHNLKLIFNSLHGKTQNKIISYFNLSDNEFKDRLLLISNDFTNFRYSYEKSVSVKVLNYDFYNELLNVLQSICKEIVEEVG